MDLSVQLYLLFLSLLYLERVVELVVSQRNVRRALAGGAVEAGRGHLPAMIVFHALYPAAAGVEVIVMNRGFPGAGGFAALAVALLAQALRWWAVASLGPRWNVRVVVPPRVEPVTRGPYLYLRHPNYLAVTAEAAAVPLIHGAWWTAGAATVLNGLLLRVRIRAEERALGPRWAVAFAGRRRLWPGGSRERS